MPAPTPSTRDHHQSPAHPAKGALARIARTQPSGLENAADRRTLLSNPGVLDIIRAGIIFPTVGSPSPPSAADPAAAPNAASASAPMSAGPAAAANSSDLAGGHGAQGDPETGSVSPMKQPPACFSTGGAA